MVKITVRTTTQETAWISSDLIGVGCEETNKNIYNFN